jgi:uridine kinase
MPEGRFRRSFQNVTLSPDDDRAAERPFLIGVAGGSNSGKTTIATRLAELMGADRLSLINLDSYYVERSDEPIDERAKANYDHPDAFDWDLLNDHVAALSAGASVDVPIYDYAIHDRSDQFDRVRATRVIVVEGILVLWEPRLRERFDLKIFVDTPADERLIRRLRRDVAERGRSPDGILAQYVATVRPSHERFIEPSKRHADVIVPEGGLNRPALEVLLARVRELAS